MPGKMKDVKISPDLHVEIIESSIPKAQRDQVVIRVVVAGSNPKDCLTPALFGAHGYTEHGDDIAGLIHEVGDGVVDFKVGDRVAAFHEMGQPYGAFGQYALAWSATTFHLPEKTSFQEAATIPLTALTAALGLYARLGLPQPWVPATQPIPLLVYGGSTAVGAFAIKWAAASNIHPIITVAGKGAPFVEQLIDRKKGDTIIDYRAGEEAVLAAIAKALQSTGNRELKYVLDAAGSGSIGNGIVRGLSPGSKFTSCGRFDDLQPPAQVIFTKVMVGTAHGMDSLAGMPADLVPADLDLAYVVSRYFTRALQNGVLTGHPVKVIPGGLSGLETLLRLHKDHQASAVKYVLYIEDTPGLKAE